MTEKYAVQVQALRAEGKTFEQIANLLSIDFKTVVRASEEVKTIKFVLHTGGIIVRDNVAENRREWWIKNSYDSHRELVFVRKAEDCVNWLSQTQYLPKFSSRKRSYEKWLASIPD